MKLRSKSNSEICEENNLKLPIFSNIVEETNSKNKIRATCDMIAKALIATLGPYGSSTIIQDDAKNHFATKDGYDLMNRFNFDDPVAKTILDLLRNTASNQVFTVGDGSTSAIVVANALYQALTSPDKPEQFEKVAPKDIVDILNDLSEMLEAELKKIAKPVSDDMSELDIIATVANNNDGTVGKMIADIYRKIGKYGFISMDVVDKQPTDTYEIKNGVEWERGYVDQIFPKMFGNEKIIYDENTRVILCNSTLTYNDLELGLIPLIQHALNQEKAQLLIVANDYDQDVINFFKTNRSKHLSLTVKTPPMEFTAVDIEQITKGGKDKLEDLALLCGCQIYDKMATPKAEIIAHPDKFVGHASKVIITPKSTQIIALDEMTSEHRKIINNKISEIDAALKKLSSIEVPTREEDEKIYYLRQRRSRLTGSTAVFHVGGKTLTERMSRQRLIEDSIFACKSSLEYGYIPGGNICIPKILLSNKEGIASVLGSKYNYLPIEKIRSFFAYFIDIIVDAFLESYRAVLNNSYMDEETVEKTLYTCITENKFYNLKFHRFEDLDKTLIINSCETDIQILRSCFSIIGILSTSNQFITKNVSSFYDTINHNN